MPPLSEYRLNCPIYATEFPPPPLLTAHIFTLAASGGFILCTSRSQGSSGERICICAAAIDHRQRDVQEPQVHR